MGDGTPPACFLELHDLHAGTILEAVWLPPAESGVM